MNFANLNKTTVANGFKAILMAVCTTFTVSMAQAQQKAVVMRSNPDQVYTVVEKQAEFKGGMTKFYDYLKNNLKYPEQAKQNKVSGKVFITFVVAKDGSLKDVKIKKGIGAGCDEEALRVFKASPKWNPGTQGGKAVNQQYTVPVMFGLTESAAVAKAPAPTPPHGVAEVDKSAQFPGGINEFYKYAAKKIKYPEAARKNNIQGKVFISFVVEEDGSLTDMKVLKGIGSGCDEEAMKALADGPKWIPGQQNGQAVSSTFTMPINFALVAK